MKLEIVKYPAQVLDQPCRQVDVFDDALRNLANNMLETVQAENGIGLAAPQVGVSQQVLVVHVAPHEPLVCVNPKIVEASGIVKYFEGCLSFPGMYEWIPRKARVVVDYQDIEGKQNSIEAEGLLAVSLQHEIDHLQGLTYLDRMSRLKRQLFTRKMGG